MTAVTEWLRHQLPQFFVGICSLFIFMSATAEETDMAENQPYKSPDWRLELKGGVFKPDLDDFERFYGDDDTSYFAAALAYRLTNWMEVGAELGYSRETGEGERPDGSLGGKVKLKLIPAQLFINFRYDREPEQLFVPYVGIGVATTWYDQEIDQQGSNDGRTDEGFAARAGIQLLMNRLDPRRNVYISGDQPLKAYAFIEYQTYEAEVDDIDLGGESYLFGFRFEF